MYAFTRKTKILWQIYHIECIMVAAAFSYCDMIAGLGFIFLLATIMKMILSDTLNIHNLVIPDLHDSLTRDLPDS